MKLVLAVGVAVGSGVGVGVAGGFGVGVCIGVAVGVAVGFPLGEVVGVAVVLATGVAVPFGVTGVGDVCVPPLHPVVTRAVATIALEIADCKRWRTPAS